jgi:hypothetical protein
VGGISEKSLVARRVEGALNRKIGIIANFKHIKKIAKYTESREVQQSVRVILLADSNPDRT